MLNSTRSFFKSTDITIISLRPHTKILSDVSTATPKLDKPLVFSSCLLVITAPLLASKTGHIGSIKGDEYIEDRPQIPLDNTVGVSYFRAR